jgi:ATP-dependent exoDNAse (exonuclease V) beta subunit
MSSLYIYQSAAGSGKTHVLVRAYLQLALKSPDSFRKILAVTFTNQATQEMKERILGSLHSMAQGLDSPMAQELMKLNKWENDNLKTRAQTVLSRILHQYDQFSVSTIDSFLQKIIRNFSKELGIQHGFTIEMDHEAVLDQVVAEVINTSTTDKQLQKWLVSFAEHKLLAGKTWHFKKAVKQLGYEFFTENFAQQQVALVQATSEEGKLGSFLKKIKECIIEFENQLQRLGIKAMEHIHKAGLTTSNFAYGERGVAGYLAGLSKKKILSPTQRAIAALERIEAWVSQSNPQKAYVLELVQKDLQNILLEIITYYQTNNRNYHTALAIQQFVYAFGIITHLLTTLRDLRNQKNMMLISDTSNLLRQIIAENDTPFIYEKIGSFYNHFLIDEFQDISEFQWHNLKPLINNGLATGHMSLLVGDVKQSIYRWRGGKWQLLSTELEKQFPSSQKVILDYNWRSKPNIIHFNNTFFTQASSYMLKYLAQEIHPLEDIDLREKLIKQLQDAASVYAHTYQQMPSNKQINEDKGYVEINFLKDEQIEEVCMSWKEQVKQRLPSLLEEIQQAGFKLQDVALLVRNNAEARELFQTLLNYQQSGNAKPGYNYAALSTESLYLGHSPWVNILISALKYLANPADIIAKTELTYLYQVYVCNNQQSISHHFFQCSLTTNKEDLLPAEFTAEFDNLTKMSLYERVVKLGIIFQLTKPASKPFIEAFQDVVLRYLGKNAAQSYNFLAWWEEKGHKQSLPCMEEQDALHIMTIHQSKGLQFKVVIVPFCTWDFDHNSQKSPILWCSTEIQPFSDFPSLPLRYHKSLQETVYAQDYYEEHIQVYLDHLNLLYVAFTRAEDRLYAFAEQPSKNRLETMADLVYQTVKGDVQQNEHVNNNSKYFLNWEQYWKVANQQLVVSNL